MKNKFLITGLATATLLSTAATNSIINLAWYDMQLLNNQVLKEKKQNKMKVFRRNFDKSF